MVENGKLTGKVVWFDSSVRRFGFIDVDGDPNNNLFVHLSDVQKSKIDPRDMAPGVKVKFRRVESPKKRNSLCATDIELVE